MCQPNVCNELFRWMSLSDSGSVPQRRVVSSGDRLPCVRVLTGAFFWISDWSRKRAINHDVFISTFFNFHLYCPLYCHFGQSLSQIKSLIWVETSRTVFFSTFSFSQNTHGKTSWPGASPAASKSASLTRPSLSRRSCSWMRRPNRPSTAACLTVPSNTWRAAVSGSWI